MSIERTLRGIETVQVRLEADIQRDEKALAEYKLQSEKAFEHEKRLKELLAEHARLNAALDLDKVDRQAVVAASDGEEAPALDVESIITAAVPMRGKAENQPSRPKKETADLSL